MDLKKTYSAREVAALTGLTARQLQWWDHHGVLSPAIAPQRTASGGYTERRYSPMDLLELSALGHLRRQGFKLGAGGSKKEKKRAVVAVARKLAVLLHRLWTSEEPYDPLYNAKRAGRAKIAA